MRGDLVDRASTLRAVEGASVVHLAANVKIVFADDLYAYGPVSGPLREDTPERPAGAKEKLRSALGKRLPPGRRAAGPPGRRAAGPPGRRAAGPPGRRAGGHRPVVGLLRAGWHRVAAR
ncbi:hypothetical protein [Saccharothrix sp. HUAS TT1]|uniref:hypothetical protein n=1 Tax=unclassified Saccharothrix TaxID=2593673 RepID=UPI00345C05D4